MRFARLYSIGILLSLALSSFVPGLGAAVLLRAALTSASWAVAGFSVLAMAGDLDSRDAEEGVLRLGKLHGVSARAVALARAFAALLRVAVAVAAPALVVLCVAWLKAGPIDALGRAVVAALSIAGYALSLGVLVSAFGRAAATLAPRAGRLLFFTLFAFSELAHFRNARIPSYSAVSSRIIDSIARRAQGGA